ncbi:FecR domain-containing protein [Prolixibacteraceae bacterium Z1-6]|uniref:FecR domain-containing protein n=1 Tax=Draconibacterium aestuarii TaxID=2998507 RepID=A0A9X3FAT4_9BACT|nr:FecR domain-containing protein [Prolixibacteraceae bacterium Z1-6]
MTDKDKIYNLIIKNLTDEISEEEKEFLEKGLSSDKKMRTSYFSLFSFWKKFFPKRQNHTIIEKTEKKLGLTYQFGARTNSWSWSKIAVSILLIVSVSFSIYQLVKPKQNITLNSYTCNANKAQAHILSDGTKVWLNSNSMLIASEPFIGDTREVTLFGEAYFEVAHNENQPFEVQTRKLKTKVLGTHFNVIAYPTDEIHEISLYEGKVVIYEEDTPNENYVLTPGDRAYFTSETGKIKIVHTDLGKEAQWRDGIIRFYDEDLFSITKQLERKFQSRIFIADSIVGNLKFTAEFEKESLERIMSVLSQAHEFDYKFTNNGVFIQSKN